MSDEKRGFLSQAWGCLTSPRGTMGSIQGGDLRKGAALILVLALISAWAGYVYASKLPLELPEQSRHTGFGPIISPGALRRSLMTISAVRDGLRVITGWLIPSVLLHLFTSLRGKGSLRRMLALTGFTSIPLILQKALRLLDAYVISEEAILSIIEAQAPGRNLALQLVREVSTVFTVFGLWAFALTIVAASINYRTSTMKAAAATSSAYLAFILLRLLLPI